MSWTVNVYFDDMLDKTHYFEDEQEAFKALDRFRTKYMHSKLYKTTIKKVEE